MTRRSDSFGRSRAYGGVVTALRPIQWVVVGLVLGGLLAGAGWLRPSLPGSARGNALAACRVTDGDTIRCGDERIRLIGIDAPEMPGHCRKNRHCAPGDPYAATRTLEEAMAGGVRIDRFGQDHYGRTLAMVSGPHGDLSCWQLSQHSAIYKRRWDSGGRVAQTCPMAVL
jgi:hypothetical protein